MTRRSPRNISARQTPYPTGKPPLRRIVEPETTEGSQQSKFDSKSSINRRPLAQTKASALPPKNAATKIKVKESETETSTDEGEHPIYLKVTEVTGNLFDAPPNTLLLHACNCKGHWGAGIANAFKENYPIAFARYRQVCRENKADSLIGTAFVIPRADQHQTFLSGLATGKRSSSNHHVGCLFTSKGFGKAKGSLGDILNATRSAVKDLVEQIEVLNAGDAEQLHGQRIERVWMPKINAGLFRVPWEATKAVLERVKVADGEESGKFKAKDRVAERADGGAGADRADLEEDGDDQIDENDVHSAADDAGDDSEEEENCVDESFNGDEMTPDGRMVEVTVMSKD